MNWKRLLPVAALSWRFWGIGYYVVRQPGKLSVVTVGLGPLRLAWTGART